MTDTATLMAWVHTLSHAADDTPGSQVKIGLAIWVSGIDLPLAVGR